MSKTAIVVTSIHHGNTQKLVNALAQKFEFDIIDATKTQSADLSGYDIIGFASGIYGGSFHRAILEFAKANMPQDKKTFFIYTSAMGKDFTKSIKKALEGKNAEVIGNYTCVGYNTFGPFKIVGGTGKGHPDETDIAAAIKFYEVNIANQ